MDATLLKDYGWAVFMVAYFAPKIFHFVTERIYPHRIKQREKQQELLQKQIEDERESRNAEIRSEREAKATLLRAQIERENRVAEQQAKHDERTVRALEQMVLAITAGNERMNAMIASQTQHANFQFGAHIELKDRLDDIQEMITYRKRIDEIEQKLTDTQDKMKKTEGK